MAQQEKIEGAQFVRFYRPVLEQFCQRMLREAGFSQVGVTGRSTDHGIDGHGTLTLNPLVSFMVLFQCKRYKDTVSPAMVCHRSSCLMARSSLPCWNSWSLA